VLIAWLEISISAGPWRGTIARAATEALGREVTLEGPLEFVPSLSPRLKVGGIRIANPPGFTTPELASLGDARLWVDAKALLQRRVYVREITAENVRVYLEIAEDRRVNWSLGRPGAPKGHTGAAALLEAAKDFARGRNRWGCGARRGVSQSTIRHAFFNLDDLWARPGAANRSGCVARQRRKRFLHVSFGSGTADELVRPTKPCRSSSV
jgi:hypothetical protein